MVYIDSWRIINIVLLKLQKFAVNIKFNYIVCGNYN